VTNENDSVWSISKVTRGANAKNSSSKPVVKHALRQQAKRRRKNTTIAAGNVAPLPRIVHPSNQVNGNYYIYMCVCVYNYFFLPKRRFQYLFERSERGYYLCIQCIVNF